MLRRLEVPEIAFGSAYTSGIHLTTVTRLHSGLVFVALRCGAGSDVNTAAMSLSGCLY